MNEKEFWSNMKRDPNTGCLLWTKGTFKSGYGAVRFNGKTECAHRVAWILTYGSVPERMHLHHLPTCKKTCCDVSHLQLLTPSQHMQTSHQTGQIPPTYTHALPTGNDHWSHKHPERVPRGEKHKSSKLTDAQVEQVRELRKQGVFQRTIAKMFGIEKTQVGRIERGESRKQ